MVSLTIQQRDILNRLLNVDTPVVISDIANQMNLTPRQVNYRLKPIKIWLAQRNVTLRTTPGVGIVIECSPRQRINLQRELDSQSNFHLILTPGQRQQLFAFNLLTAGEPFILNRLEYSASVSRTTILKDLNPIKKWVETFGLEMIRRPNYGLFLKGSEMARRQALTALLWGDVPFENPLTTMTYHQGLAFSLSSNDTQLPIIQEFSKLLNELDTQSALGWVAYAEALEDGRFTDDAALHLALAFSIQKYRTKMKEFIGCDTDTLSWLKALKVWQVSVNVSKQMWPKQQTDSLTTEIAAIAMHLLSGLRDHVWPGHLVINSKLTGLIAVLMSEVAKAYSMPRLQQDIALRDGLVAHIIPAVMRQRFNLWFPPS